MPKKTNDKPESADKQLEAKVDQMMDVNARPAAQPATPPPLDIFDGNAPAAAEVSGAPVLPGKKAAEVEAPVETKEPVIEPAPSQSAEAASETITVEPVNIDTPDSDAAIADIVAQEADQALAAEDAGIRAAEAESQEVITDDDEKHGHPIFWLLIVLLVIVAIFAAVVLTNPGLELPFSA